MLVGISKDSWWPVYSIDEDLNGVFDPIDVPDELVARWRRVNAEFGTLQDELRLVLKRGTP